MTKVFAVLTATVLATTLATASLQAASEQMAAKPMQKMVAATCPFCKMTLSTKSTKATPVPIMLHGKKYYTCAPCKAKVAAMKTTKAAPKAM